MIQITEELLNELDLAAMLATKGSWCTDGKDVVMAKDSDQLNAGYQIAEFEGPDRRHNAAFVSRLNPKAVSALIQCVRELNADAERYRFMRNYPYAGSTLLIGMCKLDDSASWVFGEEADRLIDSARSSATR